MYFFPVSITPLSETTVKTCINNNDKIAKLASEDIIVNTLRNLTCASFVFLTSTFALADAPYIDPADDHKHLVKDFNLFLTSEQNVAAFRNQEKITPTRLIEAGDKPLKLPLKLADFKGVSIQDSGKNISLDDYFVSQNVAGMLVIKDGNIVYERYGLGNNEDTLWISFSVAKSVTSMLIGAAIKDGYIKSVDEKVSDYLPRLKGSPYDQATIRNILQMSSGVEWNEDYADRNADINQGPWSTLELYQYLSGKKRVAEPGEVFNYNTAETNLVGNLLRSAIGNNLSTYLSEKIWKPFGMGSDANWGLTEVGGGEWGGCCINATLRDYGRIGLFAMNGGQLPDGSKVFEDGWMKESTTPSKGFQGYGYLWWLEPNNVFRATGIFGQHIYMDPNTNVVIAVHSARDNASNRKGWALQTSMFQALSKAASAL